MAEGSDSREESVVASPELAGMVSIPRQQMPAGHATVTGIALIGVVETVHSIYNLTYRAP